MQRYNFLIRMHRTLKIVFLFGENSFIKKLNELLITFPHQQTFPINELRFHAIVFRIVQGHRHDLTR